MVEGAAVVVVMPSGSSSLPRLTTERVSVCAADGIVMSEGEAPSWLRALLGGVRGTVAPGTGQNKSLLQESESLLQRLPWPQLVGGSGGRRQCVDRDCLQVGQVSGRVE